MSFENRIEKVRQTTIIGEVENRRRLADLEFQQIRGELQRSIELQEDPRYQEIAALANDHELNEAIRILRSSIKLKGNQVRSSKDVNIQFVDTPLYENEPVGHFEIRVPIVSTHGDMGWDGGENWATTYMDIDITWREHEEKVTITRTGRGQAWASGENVKQGLAVRLKFGNQAHKYLRIEETDELLPIFHFWFYDKETLLDYLASLCI